MSVGNAFWWLEGSLGPEEHLITWKEEKVLWTYRPYNVQAILQVQVYKRSFLKKRVSAQPFSRKWVIF